MQREHYNTEKETQNGKGNRIRGTSSRTQALSQTRKKIDAIEQFLAPICNSDVRAIFHPAPGTYDKYDTSPVKKGTVWNLLPRNLIAFEKIKSS